MKCDIIIPIFNRLELTKGCLKSIIEKTHTPYRLFLIDNGSDLKTKNFLESLKSSNENITLIRNQYNLGWVKAVNQGIRLSTSPYVCIMNNDTIVRTDNWLSKLMEVAESETDIGLINPTFEIKKKIAAKNLFIEVDFCRGYCALIKRVVIEKAGLLDESYGLGYYDDDDYSVRAIQAGFRCVRANGVLVEHLRDSTFSLLFKGENRLALHEKNKQLFYSKWGKRLKLIFIITKDIDKKKLSDILFSLARRQHIIYLWNLTLPFSLQHINIRERVFPSFFHRLFFYLALGLNKIRKEPKRYNIIFSDDIKLNSRLSKIWHDIQRLDIEKGASEINRIVDSAAKV